VPFVWLRIPPLLGAKLLQLFLGCAFVHAFLLLSERFRLDDGIRRSFVPVACVAAIHFAYQVITPDLLLTSILAYYFWIVLDPLYAERAGSGALAGGLGALAYLSKAYGFPFFVAHFLVVNALAFLRAEPGAKRRGVARRFAAGAVVFGLLSGAWIAALHTKYDRVGIGSAGSYVFAKRGPEAHGNPSHYAGFLPPPDPHGFIALEDPTLFEMPEWSPLASRSQLSHYVRLVAENSWEALRVFHVFSPLAAAVLVGLFVCLARGRRREVLESPELVALTTVLLFTGGYVFIVLRTRYLWPVWPLLLLAGGDLVRRMSESEFVTPLRRAVLLLLLAVSFVARPVETLVSDANTGRPYARRASKIRTLADVRGNIASNAEYGPTAYIALHLGGRYFGVPAQHATAASIEGDLRRFSIDYYFHWTDFGRVPAFLGEFPEVTKARTPGLLIYDLRSGRPPQTTIGPLPAL
jgi:hypothetical protein